MKKPRPAPTFKTEADERKFWETHDSTDYIDWSKAERVRFPSLKPSTTVSVADQDVASGEGGVITLADRPC